MILQPLSSNLSIIELTPDEVRTVTERKLVAQEQRTLDVLQYGKVLITGSEVTRASSGDIILFEKLACHVTNFGNPRQYVIDETHVQARLVEGDSNA